MYKFNDISVQGNINLLIARSSSNFEERSASTMNSVETFLIFPNSHRKTTQVIAANLITSWKLSD